MSTKVQFNNINYIPILNGRAWSKTSGVAIDSDYNMIIPKNDYAEVDLIKLVNTSFAYFRIRVAAKSESLAATSSVNSDVLIRLNIIYQDNNSDIDECESIAINVDTINYDSTSGYYIVDKILSSRDKRIYKATLRIENKNLNDNLVIHKLEMYTSSDINTAQLTEAINSFNLQKRLNKIICGTDVNEELLRYLKVFVNSDDSYIKVKPSYTGNKLTDISLNDDDGTYLEIVVAYEVDEDENT